MQRLSIITAVIVAAFMINACGAEENHTNIVDIQNTAVAAALTILAQTQLAIPSATPSLTPTPTRIPTETPFPVATLETLLSSYNPGTAMPLISTKMKISQIDGMVQVYIPKGNFIMGNEDDGTNHEIYLDAFWMDQTLVTNALFARCVAAGACTYHFALPGYNPRFADPAYASWPVNFVIWADAQQYCQRVGRRLPTEAEWEKAARGMVPNEELYTWGEPQKTDLGDLSQSTDDDIISVYSYGIGSSPYGILGMAGNLRQWVADWYTPKYFRSSVIQNPQGPSSGTEKVLRGGTKRDYLRWNLAVHRFSHDPISPGISRGFRCVENVNEGN